MAKLPEQARRLTALIGGGGPEVTESRARALAVDLHHAAQKAAPIVAEVTGLKDHAEKAALTPVYVTDRPVWAKAATQSIMGMAALADERHGGKNFTRIMGVAASAATAVLSRVVLGQFDPYSGEERVSDGESRNFSSEHEQYGSGERLLLNAPNIAQFREKYDLDQRDLCLWVCVHEMTHAVQYQAAPWLKNFIVDCFAQILSDDDQSDTGDPLQSESGKKIVAVMSILEGHAEYAMNAVSIMQMPGKRRIMSAMARRRAEKHPIKGRLLKLLSMDKKMEQYRVGSAFVESAIKAVGHDNFNRIWESPQMMPYLEELHNSQQWIERCIPDTDSAPEVPARDDAREYVPSAGSSHEEAASVAVEEQHS